LDRLDPAASMPLQVTQGERGRHRLGSPHGLCPRSNPPAGAVQKLRPLFAISLAVVMQVERLRPRFDLYVVPALVGAWLLIFENPLPVQVAAIEAALHAIGVAVFWAAGTCPWSNGQSGCRAVGSHPCCASVGGPSGLVLRWHAGGGNVDVAVRQYSRLAAAGADPGPGRALAEAVLRRLVFRRSLPGDAGVPHHGGVRRRAVRGCRTVLVAVDRVCHHHHACLAYRSANPPDRGGTMPPLSGSLAAGPCPTSWGSPSPAPAEGRTRQP
jgi:hypothetical protein